MSYTPAPLLHGLFDTTNEGGGACAASPSPSLHVGIVGGSMAACCAAIALANIGCRCSLFERTSGQLRSQGAGLVVQPDMADFLLHYKVVPNLEVVAVRSQGRQYLSRSGAILGGNDVPQLFSSWDVLQRALRQAVPEDAYHGGCHVVAVHVEDGRPEIVLADGTKHSCDLLIAADGGGSLVRQTFMPQVRSTYQGYVAWRGLVPETEIPQHVSELIANKFTVHQGEDWTGHILAYMIPGEDGGIAPGQRRLNWVWYENVEESKLADLLTDVNGKVHGFSVPRGLMRNDLANRQRQVARAVLPPVLADMVEATQDIFLQAIHDLLSPSHVVHGNVAFLGDSGAILRPHTAAGTTKAAVNAWLLAKCLRSSNYNVEEALKVYGVGAQQIAESLVQVGVRLGTKSQFPESGNEGGMFDI